MSNEAEPQRPPQARLASLDAYRGFIMVALAASGLSLTKAAAAFPGDPVWGFLAYQFEHVPWRGCAFWDLIQPSFMFMAGVAIPYSHASRKARGETDRTILLHTAWRSLLLVLIGVFLSSEGRPRTNWAFVNVLTQIGLGYTFVTLLRGRRLPVQGLAFAGILVVDWLAFMLYPVAGAGPEAHWNLEDNLGARVDLWFLNLFPPHTFTRNTGGYATLNFFPSMATMIAGLWAGELLRGGRLPTDKLRRLLVAGAGGLALGVLADPRILPGVEGLWSLCPIVKRLWSPTWVLFSTGWTLLLLAGFYWLVDLRGRRGAVFPLVVVGTNSIAIYLMSQLLRGWVGGRVEAHLGWLLPAGPLQPVATSSAVLLVFWAICYWMYRRKIFLKI